MREHRKQPKVRWGKLAALVGIAAAAEGFRRLLPRLRRRAKALAMEEEGELEALVEHRETPRQFTNHTVRALHDFFIPHPGNDHRPHALRPPALFTYATAAVGVKVITFLLLAVIYPSVADLATIISGDVVLLTNTARLEAGQATLQVDPVLAAAAKAKGEDMLRRGYFAHQSPDGRQPWEWIDRGRYDYVYAGENLAMDFTSAGAIHGAFMTSPSHRENILDVHYADIGVAVVSGTMDGRPVDLLVQFFGTRRSTPGVVKAAPALVQKPPAVAKLPTPVPVALSSKPVTPLAPASAPVTAPPVLVESAQTAPAEAGQAPTDGRQPQAPLELERESDLVGLIVRFAQLAFLVMFAGVAIALLLNIFIRVRVQHPSLILQSIAVLVIIATMLFSRWHFVERINETIHIL